MTLNLAQLRERVAARFPDVAQVDHSTIRFTRSAGDLPFAVYYVDIAEDLPATQETLLEYQDRVIGARYFDGRKSLQWSNYLYFVTSDDRLASSAVRRAKELIESDRTYARKFVISENDLDSVLEQPVILPADVRGRSNILSEWMNCLVNAGLERAILSDDDLPTRLAMVESSPTGPGPTTKPKPQTRKVEIEAATFIRSLQLKTFRDIPVQRSYEFGTVNLIVGPNASGKTSLLEAIELFYCGRNKRNPSPPLSYELVAVLADGRIESATARRNLQAFRDHNLAWYGQSEVKTNNLYQSFAQFNFLDTDAAVKIMDSTTRIEESLSTLLVGPEASKTWRDIERVHAALAEKLNGLRPLEAQVSEEISELEKRLEGSALTGKASDSIRVRIDEMMHRVGWSAPQVDVEAFAGGLAEGLSELVSIAQQAAASTWVESPVTIDGLAKYSREATTIIEKAEPDIGRLEVLLNSQKLLTNALERDREAVGLIEQAKRLIDAGVPARLAERSKQQSAAAAYTSWLAGLDGDTLPVLSPADLDKKVAACHQAAVSKRFAAEGVLASANSEYANFSKLRDQSHSLAQQLRGIATRILQSSARPDECPLCHTLFEPGDLARCMNVGVDEQVEALGQTLLSQIQEQKAAVSAAAADESASAWLMRYCERANLAADLTVRSALVEVDHTKRALAEARTRFETVSDELATLESLGLSLSGRDEISIRLRELGYPPGRSHLNPSEIDHVRVDERHG